MPRPINLLLITTDEHRYDYMGFLGIKPVRTPSIDRLAREGVFHPHAYTVNPLCMPARCSLLTGLYPHQHQVLNNSGDLAPSFRTLPGALRSLGYTTALIGKEHFYEGFVNLVKAEKNTKKFGWDHLWSVAGKSMAAGAEDRWTNHLRDQGLLKAYRRDLLNVRLSHNKEGEPAPTFLEERFTVDSLVADQCCGYLGAHSGEKPFFLHASFCNPHFPHDPVDQYAAKYDPEDFPAPPGCPDKTAAYFRRHAAAYAALTEQVDSYIGRVLDALDKNGLYEDTFIIFTSDHGNMLGDHGLDSKCFPFDGSARVPFIASGKRVIKKPGKVDKTAVENLDAAATFLEVAGAGNVQEHLLESPSKSLVGPWNGKKLKRRYAFCEQGYQFEAPFTMLCDGTWKYVNYSFTCKELLFNLKTDPGELKNISSKEPAKIHEFRGLMIQRLSATPPPRPAEYIYKATTGKEGKNPNQCMHNKLEAMTNFGIVNLS